MYEPGLQLSRHFKKDLTTGALTVWMYVDDVLAGEIYGKSPHDLGCKVHDIDRRNTTDIYCSSITLLKEFQGRGLSKVLLAYWLGAAAARGFRSACWHATSEAMVALSRSFGGVEGNHHTGWYGTERTAIFFRVRLQG